MRRTIPLLALATLAITACENAGESLTYPALGTGEIAVGVILDRDASLSTTQGDTIVRGVRIALLPALGRDTLQIAVSDSQGVARFRDVPIGTYRIRIDREALGDTLPVVAGDTGTIRILALPDSAGAARSVRVGYQEVTLAEARTLPPGRRVVLRGTVLSALQFFRDSSTYLSGPGGSYLRVTGATHRPGRTGNNLGDSVLVLGTSGTDNGQPVLRGGLVLTLGQKLTPIPLAISIAQAITADGGRLDAALVEVPEATITDTVTVTPDFRVRVAAGTDTLMVLLDQLLTVQRNQFAPGRRFSGRGVLVPDGAGRWFLKPRPVANEITLTNAPPTP
ncbi:MAG TPA: hypothetical protein VFN90_01210 [Gemmatimonadales bacterium]|nr:hypothetical protein [Gemmatimonadales bacterium]